LACIGLIRQQDMGFHGSVGERYFVLKASKGRIIGKSEMYSCNSGMESGIASVKKNGPDTQVADGT